MFRDFALPMQRCVIAVFADDRVDDDAVTGQALLDDPWWQWCRDNPEFLTRPASPFLAFRDQHEILRRFHVQLGTVLVAAPPAPYFSIRINRRRSSSTRIRSSAYCSRLFSWAMSSRSAGAEGVGDAVTMG